VVLFDGKGGAIFQDDQTRGLLQTGEDKPEDGSVTCFRCGVCCVKYQVNVSLIEARHIADELGLDRDKFVELYTDPRWPGTNSLLLRRDDGGCIFFRPSDGGREGSCTIHAFRPDSCRDWTPGLYRPECRDGLAKYWGLAVDSRGNPAGDEERIKCFQSFLRLLG